MAYAPLTWVEKVTKLGPTNMNHLELGVQAAAAVADAALPTPAGTNGQFLKKVGGVWVPTSFAVTDIPAASIDQTYMAAGNKVTTSLFSGGPPGSPTTGDIWIATAVDTGNLATTNGTRWKFQYNGSSGSASKWEFIGGGALIQSVSTHAVFNTMTQVGATGWYYPAGLSWSAVRAGDYEVDGIVNIDPNGANGAPFYADSFAGAVLTSAGAGETYYTDTVIGHNQFSYTLTRINGVTAAQTIGVAGLAPTPGTNKFDQGWARIRPIRVA